MGNSHFRWEVTDNPFYSRSPANRSPMAQAPEQPSDQLRGAAFHEAGHVVVARFLGLRVSEVEIGMNGDDASGRAEISCADQLSFIDQIALCAAGLEAQEMFDAPTHKSTPVSATITGWSISWWA